MIAATKALERVSFSFSWKNKIDSDSDSIQLVASDKDKWLTFISDYQSSKYSAIAFFGVYRKADL